MKQDWLLAILSPHKTNENLLRFCILARWIMNNTA